MNSDPTMTFTDEEKLYRWLYYKSLGQMKVLPIANQRFVFEWNFNKDGSVKLPCASEEIPNIEYIVANYDNWWMIPTNYEKIFDESDKKVKPLSYIRFLYYDKAGERNPIDLT